MNDITISSSTPLIVPAAPAQAPMTSLESAAGPPQDDDEEDMDLMRWIKESKKLKKKGMVLTLWRM
jgi:hypothetical protein